MNHDAISTRMKMYEKAEKQRFMPLLPVVARIDGKSFHTWTKGLDKPFDEDFIEIMQETTKQLVKETNASIGYVQSDEISLVYYSNRIDSQIFFDGKIFKMVSILASMTTAYFNEKVKEQSWKLSKDKKAYGKANKLSLKTLALFDCRVWQMPTKEEVCNYLVWREQDAVRNSIQAVGQANFSHNQLQNKNQKEIQELLYKKKDINWNDYSIAEKRGTYYQRHIAKTHFRLEEIEKLPEKHHARTNPNIQFDRTAIRQLDMPRFASLKNRTEVVFEGAKPEKKA